jgi:hypothetical protein
MASLGRGVYFKKVRDEFFNSLANLVYKNVVVHVNGAAEGGHVVRRQIFTDAQAQSQLRAPSVELKREYFADTP